MVTVAKPFPLFLCATVLAGVALPALTYAGPFEFIDNMFTFREDQKERVSPRRRLPPQVIQEPYYDPKAAEAWTGFYTRTDLAPQNYLDGSGSKVMRPSIPAPQQPMAAAPYYAEPVDDMPPAPATSVYIGEPGDLPMADNMGDDGSRLGRRTQIGAPMKDWRHGSADSTLPSRAGDYDYRLNASPMAHDDLAARAREEGQVMYGTEPGQPETRGFAANDPRYVKRNARGQVVKYRVQDGDSLSSISAQPAIYRNWKLWPLIYSANRKAIGHDPSNITDGDLLGIPRGYTKAQAAQAERKAMSGR